MSKKKVRSIKGELVDFDLLRVKQQIEGIDKPDSVEMREKYIDIRRRRNPRRNVADLVNEQRQNEQDAREKIRKSKEAKANSTKATEVPEETVAATVEPTPDVTSTPAKRTKRKVVKRSKTEE